MTGVAHLPYAHEAPLFARPAPRRNGAAVADIASDILREIDLGVLVLSAEGDIAYANESARLTFGQAALDAPFAELWAEDAEDVRLTLAAAAAATEWRSFSLTPKDGKEGAAVTLRARPILVARPPVLPSRYLLVTSDAFASAAPALELSARSHPPPDSEGGEVDAQRELIHRVKNNLALLMSLVRTARRNVHDEGADEEISGFERRLMSIAAMHDVLDAHRETSSLRADDLVRRVCEGLDDALAPEGVSISCQLEAVEVPVAIGSPIALVTNELLTNALKHGFPDGRAGEVRVSLHTLPDGTRELTVRDNGVGKEGAKAETRGSHGSGGGIVRALVMQLGGTLEAVEQNVGTGWALRFKV
ncbi:hypothetical protein DLJ53_00310 [Acuticoccus sediminis]|uniref:histidine kinase n=1 Tax=Acuticoccus sediminis TaxID=2184697 RepID=A0A8B2NYR1_9HYPH|nr:histidine kinase dimerization/phosphoacceptor domain -containing protein [Acuticoccus sediminis]RAI03016.1 hypothetical protein DLJ53_00310 [Acuticoccus sediminis]